MCTYLTIITGAPPTVSPKHILADILISRHVLSPGANEKPFNVQPAPFGTRMDVVCSSPQELLSKAPNCRNEIWIKLDLDHPDWKSYTKFTLRISWPGSVRL